MTLYITLISLVAAFVTVSYDAQGREEEALSRQNTKIDLKDFRAEANRKLEGYFADLNLRGGDIVFQDEALVVEQAQSPGETVLPKALDRSRLIYLTKVHELEMMGFNYFLAYYMGLNGTEGVTLAIQAPNSIQSI